MSTLTIVNDMRFVERNGKRIIQRQNANITINGDQIDIQPGKWEDVPMIVGQTDLQGERA